MDPSSVPLACNAVAETSCLTHPNVVSPLREPATGNRFVIYVCMCDYLYAVPCSVLFTVAKAPTYNRKKWDLDWLIKYRIGMNASVFEIWNRLFQDDREIYCTDLEHYILYNIMRHIRLTTSHHHPQNTNNTNTTTTRTTYNIYIFYISYLSKWQINVTIASVSNTSLWQRHVQSFSSRHGQTYRTEPDRTLSNTGGTFHKHKAYVTGIWSVECMCGAQCAHSRRNALQETHKHIKMHAERQHWKRSIYA